MHTTVETSNRLGFYQRNTYLAILFLLFLTSLSYGNVFQNGFVWDDFEFIVENPSIRSLSHIPSFFQESVINLYRPMRTTLYALIYAVFKTNPIGYHLTGLLLHFLCSVTLYFLFKAITQKHLPSLLGATLFAVHPIHTESVTFMTAGFDLLGPLFFLMALLFYIKQPPKLILSLGLYTVALLSSEIAITLPAVILLFDLLIAKKRFKQIVFNLIPFTLISIAYLLIRFQLLDIGARDAHYLGGSPLTTFYTMARVSIEYLRLLFWPVPLLADYRHFPIISTWHNIPFLISLALLLSTSFFLIKNHKKYSLLTFAWFWLWITLLPVSNLVPTGNVMAERYLYIPSICLGFIILYLGAQWNKWKGITLAILIIGSILLTHQRNPTWKDGHSLWTQTSLAAPKSFVAHNNLASFYISKNLINNAYDEIDVALKLKPDFVDAYINLGALYEKRKLSKKAEIAYRDALIINPNHPSALSNLGNIYLRQGMKQKALEAYQKSKQSNPNFYLADYNIGNLLFEEGKLDEARKRYNDALSIQPNFPNAHYNLSLLHFKQGKIGLAIEEMKQVVKLLPNDLIAKQTLKQLIQSSASSPYASSQPMETQ